MYYEERQNDMIIFGGLLWMVLLFIFLTRNYKKELFEKKEIFYPSACFLIEKCGISKCFSTAQKKRIFTVFIGETAKKEWRKYQCQRIAYALFGILTALLFLLLSTILEKENVSDIQENLIVRPLYGEGKEKVTKDITLKSTEDTSEQIRDILEIDVQEKKYSKEEWNILLEEVKAYIDRVLPGKNSSLDYVEDSLNLVKTYPDTSVKIKWHRDTAWILEDGSLKNTWEDDKIPDEGVLTSLTAQISCGDYKAEYEVFLRIFPKTYTNVQWAWHELETEVKKQEQKTKKQWSFEIPKTIGAYEVVVRQNEQNKQYAFVLLGAAFVFACSMIPVGNVKKAVNIREAQLLADYPKMMNRFVLLVGAGMTVRGVLERLVKEYLTARKKGGEKRYVFEELAVAVREMENGSSEADAMEAFGRRVKLMPYIRFVSLVVQNGKKGSDDLIFSLEREAAAAMEQNRERMRMRGEEAGTKLLFPMVMMLCVVLFVIMVPAFLSF